MGVKGKLQFLSKKKVPEILGAAGGVTTGIGGTVAAIAASGTVANLSAAGITSGLAALGGGMLGGLVVVGIVPVAAGLAGYGAVKGIKAIRKAKVKEQK